MSRQISTARWMINVDETAVNGEGRVQIVHKPNQKTITPSFDGAQELVELLNAILQINEYQEPATPVISDT